MKKVVVRARSIDGRVYWDGCGWANSVKDAKRMTKSEANVVMDRQMLRNRFADADAYIGLMLTIEVETKKEKV